MVLHADLNKPSKLFTAAVQPRAGERTVLFIYYTLFVPITQEKKSELRVCPLPTPCTGLCKDLIGVVGERGGVLCGSGGHTSRPLPQSKQSSLGTER